MPAPVVPDDFKACISDPSSGLCSNFVSSLLKLPVLIWKLVNYLFDSSGNPSKALVNQSLPTGSLIFSAVTLPEDGTRLLADGRDMPTVTYPDLSAALGGTSGIYGTSTAGNFRLPNYQAKFPVGIGSFAAAGTVAVGVAGGEDQHKLAPLEQGSYIVTTHQDDGDAQTGGQESIWTLEINGEVFGGISSSPFLQHGPVTIRANDDANKHDIIPPYLGVYIYIVT